MGSSGCMMKWLELSTVLLLSYYMEQSNMHEFSLWTTDISYGCDIQEVLHCKGIIRTKSCKW